MGREKISLDQGWRFHYGDITFQRNRWGWAKSGAWRRGPEGRDYDDSEWEVVSLPHDFVIATQPQPYAGEDDDPDSLPVKEEVENFNDNHIPAGFFSREVGWYHTMYGSFQKEVGWYRRHISIPEEYRGRKLYLVFEGIFRDSRIWLNDYYIGGERSGYKQIVLDITDVVNYGGDNLLSVRADAREAEGWFYEGGGIYRHAYLLVTAREHVESLFVHSRVDMEKESAEVSVETELPGEWEICHGMTVRVHLTAPDGTEGRWKELKVPMPERKEEEDGFTLLGVRKLTTVFRLEKPVLWELENPALYLATAVLCVNGEEKDRMTVRFGIRDIRFDAERGFLLNGKAVKLKGACCHQNHGGLGTALPDEIYRYRIRKLKEMGANSYRTAHYPPSPAFLDICDEEGMLVMDETRLLSSEKGDLEQLETMVKRDRNHPCVILYSLGNEEAQTQTTEEGGRIAGTMIRHVKRLDPYTPVTMALIMSDLKNRVPITDIGRVAGISEQLDVAGFNYWSAMWPVHHAAYPSQPMVCTEQGAFRCTRGCYETEEEKCHLAVTDESFGGYMTGAAQWHACRPEWMSGVHIWTGFDYYGEPKPYKWPAISSQPGAMDLCGFPKDPYYYYQSWWTDKDVLHIFPHWNWEKGTVRDMYVFSNCDEVELAVNGRSLGRKHMEQDGFLKWEQVVFEPGELTGTGFRRQDGKLVEVIRQSVKTTGSAEAVRLTEEYREKDILVVRAEIVDSAGAVVPDGNDEITFEVTGGRVLGTSNGDPSDHTPPNGPVRRAFHGLAQAIIRLDEGKIAPGSYEVRAVSGTVKDGKCSGKGTWKGK